MPDETHEGEIELENELEIEENEVQSLIIKWTLTILYINIDTRIEVADMIDEGDTIAVVQEAPAGRGRGENP